MKNSLLSRLPSEIRPRVYISGNELIGSEELRGSSAIVSFAGYAKMHGVPKVTWLPPKEFDEYRQRVSEKGQIEDEADVQRYARDLFQVAYNNRATDIRISDEGSYGRIRFRRFGLMQDYEYINIDFMRRLVATIFGTMCSARSDGDFSPMKQQDARIAKEEWLPKGVHSMRVHTEPIQVEKAESGVGTLMVLRMFFDAVKVHGSLEERVQALGFDEKDSALLQQLTQRVGVIIVAGPTGHGKSTLLRHIIEAQVQAHPDKAVMSTEDPVEYPIEGCEQGLVCTKTSSDPKERARAYSESLAGKNRSDPDIIFVGEIRYPEAAYSVVDMALTGHSVWTTTHSSNAFAILKRMLSFLEAAELPDPISYLTDHNIIAGLICQRLIPLLCPHCKMSLQELLDSKTYHDFISDDVLRRVQSVINPESFHNVFVRNSKGCDLCNNMGLSGQIAASEIVYTTSKLLHIYRTKGEYEAQKYWINELHGRTFVERAVEHVASGLVDPTLAEKRLEVPLDFEVYVQDEE